MSKRLPILLAAFALIALSTAHAQHDPAPLRAALEAAERGLPAPALPATHPAQRWVEMATLRRNIDTLPNAQAQAFLSRYQGEAVAEVFREAWLRALLKRQDWTGYRAAWSSSISSPALRCAELDARRRVSSVDPQWTREAQAMWRSGKSVPDECDPVFDALAASGGLDEALRWERSTNSLLLLTRNIDA